jgi:hypothetical protein
MTTIISMLSGRHRKIENDNIVQHSLTLHIIMLSALIAHPRRAIDGPPSGPMPLNCGIQCIVPVQFRVFVHRFDARNGEWSFMSRCGGRHQLTICTSSCQSLYDIGTQRALEIANDSIG